jgi:integral membrane protein
VSNPLRLLRVVLLIEAVSYLVLWGVAMPLKYWYDRPMAVSVVGMIHGILFLLMIWLLLRAHFEAKWSKQRMWLILAASIVPLWPFALDRRVRQWVHEGVTAPPAGGTA